MYYTYFIFYWTGLNKRLERIVRFKLVTSTLRKCYATCHSLEPTVSALPARQLSGADSQIRTGDLHFTKVLLYQLSYIGNRRLAGERKHCFTTSYADKYINTARPDSIGARSRPSGGSYIGIQMMERETRLELATSSLGRKHSTTELLPLTVSNST